MYNYDNVIETVGIVRERYESIIMMYKTLTIYGATLPSMHYSALPLCAPYRPTVDKPLL